MRQCRRARRAAWSGWRDVQRRDLGGAGLNGPIVIPLTPPTTGDPGASSGCVTIQPALARAIKQHPRRCKQHPRRYYFNVHTANFPNGAVRGQIHERRF